MTSSFPKADKAVPTSTLLTEGGLMFETMGLLYCAGITAVGIIGAIMQVMNGTWSQKDRLQTQPAGNGVQNNNVSMSLSS